MRFVPLSRIGFGIVAALAMSLGGPAPGALARVPRAGDVTLAPRAYLPAVSLTATCPSESTSVFDLIPIAEGYYKDNRLTDENADFRLSILGYAPSGASLDLVEYGGDWDLNAPNFKGIFEPNRIPVIRAAYQVHGWNWSDSGPNLVAPYGSRAGVNTSWPAHVIDLVTTRGEVLQIPERSPIIWPNNIALVLFAAESELTFAYTRNDSVLGYVVHMMNLCVNPALVTAYRAQLDSNGRRATGSLPGLRAGQTIGTARAGWVTVAIRDTGAFMDSRSRKDWWQ